MHLSDRQRPTLSGNSWNCERPALKANLSNLGSWQAFQVQFASKNPTSRGRSRIASCRCPSAHWRGGNKRRTCSRRPRGYPVGHADEQSCLSQGSNAECAPLRSGTRAVSRYAPRPRLDRRWRLNLATNCPAKAAHISLTRPSRRVSLRSVSGQSDTGQLLWVRFHRRESGRRSSPADERHAAPLTE